MKDHDKYYMPLQGTDEFLQKNNAHVARIEERFAKTHKIEAIMGCEVNLKTLQPNQSVAVGDGMSFHFLLTKLA